MGMDKYGFFMQMYVYYYWNNSQRSMKTRHVSKVIDVFQRTCSCLFDAWKKEIPGSHYFSFFALINLLTNLFTFLQDSAAHFFWTCKMHIAYIIYYYICLSHCAHILYFDAAKFSIKLFSFIYLTVSVVSQRDEYEIVTETQPIKTT